MNNTASKKSKLCNAIKEETNLTVTANGDTAYKSSLNAVLDLFASGYACRNNTKELERLVREAFLENPLYALRTLYYLRNIRNGTGCGERSIFRHAMRYIISTYPDKFIKNKKLITLIPEFGRYDDLIDLIGADKDVDIIIGKEIYSRLSGDIRLRKEGKQVSLLAKWLPSFNASSLETKKKACKVLALINKIRAFYKRRPLTQRDYRKILSSLRNAINIIETKLVNRDYANIDYSKIPSKAHLKYIKSFFRNDSDRYTSYLDLLKKGKGKINASTISPHEIVEKFFHGHSDSDEALDALWKNLPNYFGESKNSKWLPVIDVSGSMMWASSVGAVLPIYASLGLGIYVSERNSGAFKDEFITFSKKPQMVHISEEYSICKKIKAIMDAGSAGYNTDIEAVFDLVLKTARNKNLSQDDMPDCIIIISDMQFDEATEKEKNSDTSLTSIKNKYKRYNYKMPKLVFWNVNTSNVTYPALKDESDVVLIGGYCPGMYDVILGSESPEDFMLNILNSEPYNKITLD